VNLPQLIQTYWTANKGSLPNLWLEYAPDTDTPPVAVVTPAGFARDYANAPFYMDTYKYKFSILDIDAVSAYTNGFAAITMMTGFTCPGLINITSEPEQFATPFATGQINIWAFEFSIDFLVTPS
jgi:hypothetical protein